MKYVVVIALALIFSASTVARTLMNIPEPVRKTISISQLGSLGIIPELGPVEGGKVVQWLRFEVPESIEEVYFSFARVKLFHNGSLITSYEVSSITVNNKDYVGAEINTSIVTCIAVEFWFNLRYVYEVSFAIDAI